jgi:hypothetical protein
MPPKRAGGSDQTVWTDEAKVCVVVVCIKHNANRKHQLEFVTKFFYSQVQGKLDWKSAPIPEGRTMNACNHLMRGLKAKYITADSNSGNASENSESAKAKSKKTSKAVPKVTKKRKLALEDGEDEILAENDEELIKSEEV